MSWKGLCCPSGPHVSNVLPPLSTVAGSDLQVRHRVLFKLGVIVRSRPHVRVKERVIGVRRVRVSRRVAAGVAVVQRISPGEKAKVQLACVGTVTAALTAVAIVVKVLHLHEPLGPELPPHPLAEHGQVDELSCRGQKMDAVHTSNLLMSGSVLGKQLIQCEHKRLLQSRPGHHCHLVVEQVNEQA